MLARGTQTLARAGAASRIAGAGGGSAAAAGVQAVAGDAQSRFCALEASFSSARVAVSASSSFASPFAVSASAADLAFASSLAAQLQEQQRRLFQQQRKQQQLLQQQLSHRRSPFAAKARVQPFRAKQQRIRIRPISSPINSSKPSGSSSGATVRFQPSDEQKECELPMDMECGCKTKREKEQQDAEALARACVQVARSDNQAVVAATAGIADVRIEPETEAAASFAPVVVTSSAPPQHLHARSVAISFESSFHRRHLPQDCIAFSSPEGRKLFTQAINSANNYMQIYFPLAEQFITQAEPAYCGLATLAMCLNALEIDPGRLWKGPWRWFSEELFDCCTSLSVAKEKGISLSEFICLARCNGVLTDDLRADNKLSLEDFRAIVKRSCSTNNEIVVLNYSRKVLGQTGDGHFSPIGGYHEENDMVLLLDVARFKYPPHWVRLPLVFQAMQKIDESIGLPRGLVVLKENAHATGPTLVKQLVHSATPELPIKPAPTVCCGSAVSIESARHVAALSNQS